MKNQKTHSLEWVFYFSSFGGRGENPNENIIIQYKL